MAEISESSDGASGIPDKTKDSKESGKSELATAFDRNTMRKTKPGLKRFVLTLTVLFSFLLGLPFLLKSIEIYRSPLPFREIDSLSAAATESSPLLFPCRFQAVFVDFDHGANTEFRVDELGLSILGHMRKFTGTDPVCGTCASNYTISVTLDASASCVRNRNVESACLWRCGALNEFNLDDNLNDDEGLDEYLESVLGGGEGCLGSGGKVYTVAVVNRVQEVKTVVGKHRHAWIIGKVSEADAAERIAEVFVKLFVNAGKEEGSIHGEFMPVGADGKVVLSFNLLNADPSDWIYDWDFQKIDEILVAPVIEALGDVANISVESQVLYHTPKSSFSYWDDKQESYIFHTNDLPFFVNSNEWHLDTSIAAGGRSKILQFVVYVPSAMECPLLLQLPNGEVSMTNGFISPMWGGVIVWNPPGCLKESESMHPVRRKLSPQDLQNVFEVFMGQFRQLFGLKSDNLYVGASGTFILLASQRGFTEWELDVLSRQHACFNLLQCATTLASLSRLVQSLPRMIIMDEIGKQLFFSELDARASDIGYVRTNSNFDMIYPFEQVKFSLEAAKLAQINASLGIFDASAVSSRQARSLAEDAFFHPSVMSVSYYSFEHCFAVYSPFFLPVSLHVLLATVKECRRYKRERNKYLAWRAKGK